MIRSKRDLAIGILLILPGFLLMGVFVYGFIAWTIRVSISQWDSIVPDYSYVGLQNYHELLNNERFQIDILNTIFFTIFFLSFCIILGFILAILLERINRKAEHFFRNLFLLPMAISFVVTGVAWRWIFNPTVGLNSFLKALGVKNLWGWATDPTSILGFHLALIPVIIAAGWQLTGYTMAMLIAGLRGIPEDIFEASRIDGASELQIIWHITIPLLKSVFLAAIILLGHISLKIFDLVYTMTGRGPAFATDFPGIFMWDTTFKGNRYAEGAAISVFMLFLVAGVIIPYLVNILRKEKNT